MKLESREGSSPVCLRSVAAALRDQWLDVYGLSNRQRLGLQAISTLGPRVVRAVVERSQRSIGLDPRLASAIDVEVVAQQHVDEYDGLDGPFDAVFVGAPNGGVIVYKGLLTPRQLELFYPDLADERWLAWVAVFHHRFATNTLPSWSLAQPFRLVAHNGEINTVRGNRLWMRAREREMRSPFWGDDLATLLPITSQTVSDSASFDHVLEFLRRSGRDLFHSLMLMVPDPYHGVPDIPPELRDFFVYHETLMEPWDGPAALVFTDGEVVGAKLDRNALRPLRYTVTGDGLIIIIQLRGTFSDYHLDN